MAQHSDDRLRLLVERYERLTEELLGIQQDRKDVLMEAKAVGYDAATFRKLIARRRMAPDDRAEADALLELYESALGMGSGPARAIPPPPDAMELATLLLAEQIVGLEDRDRAALLVGHVTWLLAHRAEIREMRAEETARRRQAKGEGFDEKQIAVTVRWFEKVAKHGMEAMRLGEETFHLYRGEFDRAAADVSGATADPKLQALLAPPPAKAPNKAARNLDRLRGEAEAARKALRR